MEAIATMHPDAVDLVRRLETEASKCEQVNMPTQHTFHAGVYSRTVMIPAGVMITGALIKIPTQLIVSGDTTVFIGGEPIRLTGYHVIKGGPGRKQAFVAHSDTWLTMFFATDAETVEQAEAEFTDEVDLLLTNKTKSIGGASCRESLPQQS